MDRLKLMEIALGEYGNIEVAGADSSPDVMKYFKETGRGWVDNDETPWCDAFADWVVKKAGGTPSPGLNARAWLDCGTPRKDPRVGYLVIFWRVSRTSAYGHVGFFVRRNRGHIWVLGGNQSDMVRISPYPEERLLGFREL